MQPGQGQGLSLRDLGEASGSENITLLVSEIPVHTHSVGVSVDPANAQIPTVEKILARSAGGKAYQSSNANLVTMAPQILAPSGGSLPHNNLQPYLVLNYCIALQGIFPQRP